MWNMLQSDRAELQRLSTELGRFKAHEASQAVTVLSEEKAQLESEKNALLDYIQDSVDKGAEARKKMDEQTQALASLEEEVTALRTKVILSLLMIQSLLRTCKLAKRIYVHLTNSLNPNQNAECGPSRRCRDVPGATAETARRAPAPACSTACRWPRAAR